MFAGQVALIVAALFAGAAVYINVAEQPARLALDDRALLAQWKPAYKRGFAMGPALAPTGLGLGILPLWKPDRFAFVVGAIFLFANWPWPFFGIMPPTQILAKTAPADAGAQTRALIVKWNRLHS